MKPIQELYLKRIDEALTTGNMETLAEHLIIEDGSVEGILETIQENIKRLARIQLAVYIELISTKKLSETRLAAILDDTYY